MVSAQRIDTAESTMTAVIAEHISTEKPPVNPKDPFGPSQIIKAINKIKHDLILTCASVKLTIVLLSVLASMVLLGAWCPQISQVGKDKVIEQFGPQTADLLTTIGIADIFHSYAFLTLIALITVNIVCGSFKHVFPKLKQLRLPMPWLNANQISKLPAHKTIAVQEPMASATQTLIKWLKKHGYTTYFNNNQLTAESGKIGRLAPTVTHIGLLSLLTGVIISSWTGFSGFKMIPQGESFSLGDSEHSRLWLGKLPKWLVKVNETRREDYATGEAKQWYSNLSVIDANGHPIKNQTISVNEPLSFDGVDIYQSSWGLKMLKLRINGQIRTLDLRSMGKLYAAFLPLPDNAVIIFSIRNQTAPLRVFAKRQDWAGPKLLTEIPLNQETHLGSVSVKYAGSIAQTGLQYKCDPGLPVVYVAFALIIAGISLAAIPHRQVWAKFDQPTMNNENSPLIITIGGTTKKGKQSFAKQIASLAESFPTHPLQTEGKS